LWPSGRAPFRCGWSFHRAGFIGNGLRKYDIRKYRWGAAPVGRVHCISNPELWQAMVKALGWQQAVLHNPAVIQAMQAAG